MIAICVRKNRPESVGSGSATSGASSLRHLFTVSGATALVSMGLLLVGCSKKEEARVMPPRTVTAATAQAQDLPLYIDSLGRTQAYESVQVVPQVSGTLEKIGFAQGTPIQKGDLLFEIDPALYRAAVMQAEGALMQAKAQLSIDERQLERSRSLLPDKLISEQEFQTLEAKVEADKGAVQLAQGQLDSAQVNLGYSVIHSPIDGLIGFYEVTEGNVVSAAAGTVLTSIQRLDPLYADFNVTDRDFIGLRKHFFEQDNQLPVVVSYLAGDGPVTREAKLEILGNEINRSTGTVRLRAQVQNKDYAFWPEQPVAVRVILQTLKDAVTVPSLAVGIGQAGEYVFIIEEKDGKQIVNQVPVKVGQTHDNGQTIIVTEGLKAGQRVVLEGQVFLQSGQQVVVKDQDAAARPSKKDAKGAAVAAPATSAPATGAAAAPQSATSTTSTGSAAAGKSAAPQLAPDATSAGGAKPATATEAATQ